LVRAAWGVRRGRAVALCAGERGYTERATNAYHEAPPHDTIHSLLPFSKPVSAMRPRMVPTVVLVVALALAANGCVSINEVMASWEGDNVGNLIASWGPPQLVYDDGNGGKIFVYATDRTWTTPGKATTTTNGSFNAQGTNMDGYVDAHGNFNS